jgi:hypothetical protein
MSTHKDKRKQVHNFMQLSGDLVKLLAYLFKLDTEMVVQGETVARMWGTFPPTLTLKYGVGYG